MKLLISTEKKKYLCIIKCSNQKESVKGPPAAENSGLSRKSGMSVTCVWTKFSWNILFQGGSLFRVKVLFGIFLE